MLCRGEFSPRDLRDGRLLNLTDDAMEAVCRDIEQARWRLVCLNDSERIADFGRQCERLKSAFDRLLPLPSSYEC